MVTCYATVCDTAKPDLGVGGMLDALAYPVRGYWPVMGEYTT